MWLFDLGVATPRDAMVTRRVDQFDGFLEKKSSGCLETGKNHLRCSFVKPRISII
jgi:hypothetical protein